jgi:hypothetical protein
LCPEAGQVGRQETVMGDYDTFPVNDAGEPLMTPEGWRYEQYLDDEPEYDERVEYDDPERMGD